MFFIPEYLDPERNAGPGDRPAFFAFFSVPGMLTGNAISVLIIGQSVLLFTGAAKEKKERCERETI